MQRTEDKKHYNLTKIRLRLFKNRERTKTRAKTVKAVRKTGSQK